MAAMYERHFDFDECIGTLASVDLYADVLSKPVRALSKGMTQNLGISSWPLSGREMLVLDEPGSGLGPNARALIKTALKSVKSSGRTVFLTSHSLSNVDEICDDMAILHQGSLRFAGTPAALKQRHDASNLEQAYLACIGES
jgi:ABC-2 type transport system ATP-binding protein